MTEQSLKEAKEILLRIKQGKVSASMSSAEYYPEEIDYLLAHPDEIEDETN